MIVISERKDEKDLLKKVKKAKHFLLYLNGPNTEIYYSYSTRVFKFSYEEVIRGLIQNKLIILKKLESDSLIFKNISKIKLDPKIL